MAYSKSKKQYIIEQYLLGRTQKDIATELGTYNTTIRRILLNNKVNIRPNEIIQRKVKSNIFNKPHSDYWLGLLAADGCIFNNYIRLELRDYDLDTIKQFKEFLGSDVSIITTRNKSVGFKSICFSNRESVKHLKDCGIEPNKSLTLSLNIPLNLDILRGIFDGDGSIGIYKGQYRWSIVSASKDFAKQIQDYLISLGFSAKLNVNNSNLRKNPLYSVLLHKQTEIYALYQLMYKDAKYFMKRKYLKFGCLKEKFFNE